MRSSDTNPTNYTSYSNYTSMENTVTGRDTQRSANRNIIEKFTENFYEIKT